MRLSRSDPDGAGIHRVRSGRGFRYVDDAGEPVRDPETVERIRDLVIPPAWREVWISLRPGGHIQAVGTDEAGRRQYLYHEQWRARRDREKHDRVLVLAERLPEVRERIETDLAAPGLGSGRVLAGALRILDRGVFRTGGEEYVQANDSHGVTTLLRGHVQLRRGELRFRFPAKSGVARDATIRDAELAPLIAALRRGRTDDERLFTYRERGQHHLLTGRLVNERFRELADGDDDGFTVKDLRTWTATVLAAGEFAAAQPASSERAFRRARAQVMRAVAEELGNTPAVAARSYVDPRVVRLYRNGRITQPALLAYRPGDLNDPSTREKVERAVLDLLS